MFTWIVTKKRHYKFLVFAFLFFLSLPSWNIFLAGLRYLQQGKFFQSIFLVYLQQTIVLGIGVCVLSLILGLVSAIFVTFFEFPARKVLEWGLILPFVLPSYILAYIYTDFLEYAGFLQTSLRGVFGWQSQDDYWFFQIRSMSGAIFVLSFSLYPYLYLVVRRALANQSETILQSGQLLGYNFLQNIFYLLLPLAKKSIFLGLVVVLVHAIHDFGVVEYFSVYTLSLGIYDLWFQRGDFLAASYLSSLVICVLFFLVLLDVYLNLGVQGLTSNNFYQRKRITPTTFVSILLFLFCFLIVFLGFLLPTGILVYYSLDHYQSLLEREFWQAVWNSTRVGVITVVLVLFFSSLFAYFLQRLQNNSLRYTAIATIFGYALPSTILSIGIVLCAKYFDNTVNFLWFELFSENLGLVLGGSLLILIFAYSVKFFAVAQSILGESMLLITPSLDASGRSLGYYNIRILKNVYLPIAKKGFLTVAIILFVDILRELPLTLILRPVDFETLATYTYQYASDEMLEQTAISALFIILISLIPSAVFCYNINQQK